MWDELDDELTAKPSDGYDSLFHSSVWYEKYRPKTLDEMILPDYIKDKLRVYIQNGGKTMPHLGLFSRLPGTGKSSLAKVLMRELNAEALWINASLERGIDVLRTRIQQFASQTALRDCVKIVVMSLMGSQKKVKRLSVDLLIVSQLPDSSLQATSKRISLNHC